MILKSQTENLIKSTILKLLDYCRLNNWGGFDPFDGLNSKFFSALPFLHTRFGRLAFIQGMKRSPINLRPLLLVKKQQNPKGIALFISAILKLSKLQLIADEQMIEELIETLIVLKSPNKPSYCWGYNFDWQNRIFFLPKYEPNIIVTTFAANALIDAYEIYGDPSYLDIAVSAGQFILTGFNTIHYDHELCFSYTPQHQDKIHNANLLGASFLARLYNKTSQKVFLDFSLKASRYSVNRQNRDGSWFYGEHESQKWIDNFHSGYNLCALHSFCQYTKTVEFESCLRRGFEFYRKHFFQQDGAPRYYHNRLYPIDIHSAAQSIITLTLLRKFDKDNIQLALSIFAWAISHMWDEKGYFYYQILHYGKNKISYMRWSQAWMLLALATLLEGCTQEIIDRVRTTS